MSSVSIHQKNGNYFSSKEINFELRRVLELEKIQNVDAMEKEDKDTEIRRLKDDKARLVEENDRLEEEKDHQKRIMQDFNLRQKITILIKNHHIIKLEKKNEILKKNNNFLLEKETIQTGNINSLNGTVNNLNVQLKELIKKDDKVQVASSITSMASKLAKKEKSEIKVVKQFETERESLNSSIVSLTIKLKDQSDDIYEKNFGVLTSLRGVNKAVYSINMAWRTKQNKILANQALAVAPKFQLNSYCRKRAIIYYDERAEIRIREKVLAAEEEARRNALLLEEPAVENSLGLLAASLCLTAVTHTAAAVVDAAIIPFLMYIGNKKEQGRISVIMNSCHFY